MVNMVSEWKIEHMTDDLHKENLHMPRAVIMDLLKMYQKMTPEQKKAFDEEVDKAKVHPMEQVIDDVLDNTQVHHFENPEEADEFLRSEGKLEQVGV